MDLILTVPGILGLGTQIALFGYFARVLPLGALSLPCMTILTSLVYFYVMPAVYLMAGNDLFFGNVLTSLEGTHLLTLLYIGGAATAFIVNRRALFLNPAQRSAKDMPPNWIIYFCLWGVAMASVAALVALGALNLLDTENYETNSERMTFAFLNLGLTIVEPLILVYLVRNNFGFKSLGVFACTLYLCLIAGFRIRILILLCAAAICFGLVRKMRIRSWMVVAGCIGGIMLMNLIGMIRSYGAGLKFQHLQADSIAEVFSHFGGEIGPVFVIQNAVTDPSIALVWFEPWTVAFERLVPTFLWPDKPTALYLQQNALGFLDVKNAMNAGIAAPQHVEMLYQFGWLGVPFLAFLYFSLATRLGSPLMRLGREARIAGFALIPPFFGYFMQTRGYFFQMFTEAIFTFLPLFFLSLGGYRRPSRSGGADIRTFRPAARQSAPQQSAARHRSGGRTSSLRIFPFWLPDPFWLPRSNPFDNHGAADHRTRGRGGRQPL